MEAIIHTSVKEIAAKQMNQVLTGGLSLAEAEAIVKRRVRYSLRTREALVEGLTRQYDPECVRVFQFFGMI